MPAGVDALRGVGLLGGGEGGEQGKVGVLDGVGDGVKNLNDACVGAGVWPVGDRRYSGKELAVRGTI